MGDSSRMSRKLAVATWWRHTGGDFPCGVTRFAFAFTVLVKEGVVGDGMRMKRVLGELLNYEVGDDCLCDVSAENVPILDEEMNDDATEDEIHRRASILGMFTSHAALACW